MPTGITFWPQVTKVQHVSTGYIFLTSGYCISICALRWSWQKCWDFSGTWLVSGEKLQFRFEEPNPKWYQTLCMTEECFHVINCFIGVGILPEKQDIDHPFFMVCLATSSTISVIGHVWVLLFFVEFSGNVHTGFQTVLCFLLLWLFPGEAQWKQSWTKGNSLTPTDVSSLLCTLQRASCGSTAAQDSNDDSELESWRSSLCCGIGNIAPFWPCAWDIDTDHILTWGTSWPSFPLWSISWKMETISPLRCTISSGERWMLLYIAEQCGSQKSKVNHL